MKTQFKSIYFLVLIFLGAGMAGCSSDDGPGVPTYTGSTTQAAITGDNAEELGKKSSDGSRAAVNADIANSANPLSIGVLTTNSSNDQISEIVATILSVTKGHDNNIATASGAVITAADFNQLLSNYGITDIYICGGNVVTPDSYSGTMTFNALCVEIAGVDRVTLNGSVTYSAVVQNSTLISSSFSYINFSVTTESTGEIATINMTVACNFSPTISCSIYSDFVGDDGLVYRVENFTIAGDTLNGFSITAKFYHPTHGYVDITTTTPITFGCSDGRPDAGEIRIDGAGGSSATITFDSCTSFSGSWNDGTNSESFSGTW